MAKKQTRYQYHYLMRVPMTHSVTTEEGGVWIPFHQFKGGAVHSIRFWGGHEWDCINGWRNNNASSTAGRSLTCRTSKPRGAPVSYIPVNGLMDFNPYPVEDWHLWSET